MHQDQVLLELKEFKGELKEFKRVQLEHNGKVDAALSDLTSFKSKMMGSARTIAFIISTAISLAGALISLWNPWH